MTDDNKKVVVASSVKVLARTPSKLEAYKEKISIVEGSATDAAALSGFLDGIDVLISTIGSTSKEHLVVEDSAKALVEALQKNKARSIPRILWMTTIGVNEAITQCKSYTLFGQGSPWFFGYGMFGLLVMKFLIPVIIGQALWDDMGLSEDVMRSDESIQKRTCIVRPTNMHPVSEHKVFSEEWRKEGGDNLQYKFVSAEDPPPGNWINRRTIAAALCDLVKDESRDGTAVSLFQEGKP